MNRTPWPIRLFSAVAGALLPRRFEPELRAAQRDALADQYRRVRARGLGPTARFWLHEAAGLLVTSAREHRDGWRENRRARGHRGADADSTNRKPEMLNTAYRDLLYAFRMIVKTPVVTIIAILSIALGVAANTTIFSVAHSWLLRPLPYPDADRMVMVYENNRNDPDPRDLASPANFFDWQEQTTSFDTWIASQFTNLSLTGIDRPQEMIVAVSTPNIFADLRAEPILGRTFAPDEGGPEDAPVVVLSEATWRGLFGADPDIVNATIMLNGEAHTVIGVMPETFDFILGTVNLWIPYTFEGQRDGRGSRYLNVTAWRRADVPLERARAELVALASRLEEEHPATNENWGVNVVTVREQFPSSMDIGLIMILGIVVGMALLIACANVASLLLAKTDARQKELAVRVALGAGRGRLVQQLLTESVVLAVIAGGLGTVLSIWGVGGLREALPAQIPRFYFPQLDATVIAFSLGLSVLAGLTFGITPATQVFSTDLRSALTDSTRSGTAGRRKKRLRSAFVMAEFAMALTILIAAAVLTDLVNITIDVDPGYDSSDLMTMEVTLPYYKYQGTGEITQFVNDLERELARLPGSRSAALTSHLPRAYSLPSSEFTIDGRPVERNEEPRAAWLSVSPGFLGTLDISLRAGRTITEADRAGAAAVVLVSQRLVDQFFTDQEPLGRRITIQGESREIVGVVADIAQTRLAGFEPVRPTVYFPMAQRPVRTIRLAVRTPGDPYQVAGPAQSAIWRVDPDQPVSAVQTLDEFIDMQLAGPTFMTDLLYIVGLLALALAAIGVYGVMAYSVSQQTNEIGIRMALGAKPRQVLTRITRQGATLAGAGLLIGVPIAFLVVRAIAGLPMDIPGMEAGFGDFDVRPVLAVSLVLAGVGLVACVLPARRATRIDPVTALREE